MATSTSKASTTSRRGPGRPSKAEQLAGQELLPQSTFSLTTLASVERFVNDLVKMDLLSPEEAGVMRHVMAPRNHKNYMSYPDACAQYGITAPTVNVRSRITAACYEAVKGILYGIAHEKYNEERAATLAQENDRERRPRRAKDEIALEKATKQARVAARAKFGIPPVGRLDAEQTEKVNAEVEKIMKKFKVPA